MPFIDTIRIFFTSKSQRELLVYYGIFVAFFVFIVGLVMGLHFSTMAMITRQLAEIKKQRVVVQDILTQNKTIMAQQEAVKTILAEQPNFYITQNFDELLQSLGLQADKEGPIPSDVGNGFVEQKLSALFSHINMKQLTELLYKIEQNPRVYTKELKITKDIKDGLLNATLVIATLEQQQKTA